MNLQPTMTLLLIVAIIASSTGCASITVKQAWSSNFALADGATANDPAIIDGNVATLGQSQYVEATGDAIMGMGAQSEAVILLPEPKAIHRVVIRSPNLLAFDIWISDAQGRWEKIKEVQSNKKKIIDTSTQSDRVHLRHQGQGTPHLRRCDAAPQECSECARVDGV